MRTERGDARQAPRRCGANRSAGETGVCATGRLARVASFGPHFGEEDPLVGRHGSGTVFFAGCNLNCSFCQNADTSQGPGAGREVTAGRLARIFTALREAGCHNLNLVTPTHVLPQVLEALAAARLEGFAIVWNCGGYESLDALALLDGVVDIYMPDLKFADSAPAAEFCRAPDYPETARAAVTEMHRQVGDLEIDDRGIAVRGLLVRHLVMPNGLAGTDASMRFLASLSPRTYVNVMGQYRPEHIAAAHPTIGRRPRRDEIERARGAARAAGLQRLDGEEPFARRVLRRDPGPAGD
ncbi:MAG: radical SAM protein [Myxococcota bacterium]|nr:radical SAM protein [Myxococcota bacterium]